MLVLSRKQGQSIVIGDEIVVTVLEVRGDQVRLGIEAPRELPVNRREIYDLIRAENIAAAQASPDLLQDLDALIATSFREKDDQDDKT